MLESGKKPFHGQRDTRSPLVGMWCLSSTNDPTHDLDRTVRLDDCLTMWCLHA